MAPQLRVDFSDEALTFARRLAKETGLQAQFDYLSQRDLGNDLNRNGFWAADGDEWPVQRAKLDGFTVGASAPAQRPF